MNDTQWAQGVRDNKRAAPPPESDLARVEALAQRQGVTILAYTRHADHLGTVLAKHKYGKCEEVCWTVNFSEEIMGFHAGAYGSSARTSYANRVAKGG
jgi:hypothetical protein